MSNYIWKDTGFSWVLYYGAVRHFNRMGSVYLWDELEGKTDALGQQRLVFEPREGGYLYTEEDISEIYNKIKELNEARKAKDSAKEEASDHNQVWGESKI